MRVRGIARRRRKARPDGKKKLGQEGRRSVEGVKEMIDACRC